MVADTLIDRLQLRQMWRRVERGSEAIRKCDPQRNEEAANQIMRDMFNDLLRNLATGIGAYGRCDSCLRNCIRCFWRILNLGSGKGWSCQRPWFRPHTGTRT